MEAYGLMPESACDSIVRANGEPVCAPAEDGKVYAFNFFMGANDAMAFLGCTPPPMSYFGMDMDISMRFGDSADQTLYPGANFADALSYRRIHTASGSPFDSLALIVHSADQEAMRQVQAAYKDLGVPQEAINGYQIPSSDVRFFDRSEDWKEALPDTLIPLLRMAQPVNKAGYEQYKKLLWPVRFYIAKEPSSRPAHPFDYQYLSRKNRFNEREQLGSAWTELVERVKSVLQEQHGARIRKEQPGSFRPFGFYDDWKAYLRTIDETSTPILPTRDGSYNVLQISDAMVESNTGLAAVGVVHARESTLDCAYQEAMLHVRSPRAPYRIESFVFWNQTDLAGSAKPFFPSDDPAADDFFVVLALPGDGCRKLGLQEKPFCRRLESRGPTLPKSFVTGGERVYVAKDSGIGPDADTAIPMTTLVFDVHF
eukprot:scaffold8560_cov286-Pinguiococcus_pyrenoidosus.AAC.1